MRRALMIGFATLLSTPLLAQEQPRDTFKLSEIVVTATRLPTSRASVASSVTVISGDALRAQGIRYVAEALRAVPGAALAQNGSFGATTSLFLRGGESDYVQVLVDGVSLNGAGGTFDFGSLTTDNVDRIEVVAGPTSVLYGSDAVAGVIQIFTRRGQGKPAVEAGMQAGTYNSVAMDAGFRGGDDRLDYSFGLSRFTTDGSYAFNNNHRNVVGSGRVHVAPDSRTDATLTLRHGDAVFHYPTDGGGRLVDQNQFTFNEGTAFGLDAGRFLADRIEGRVLLAANEVAGGSDDRQDSPADTLGFYGSESITHSARRSVDARANVHLRPGTVVTVGGQVMFENARGFSEFSSQYGPSTSQSEFHRLNRGYYAQALLEPMRGLSLTAGGRIDDNETFGTFETYRVGGSFRWLTGSRIRASIGTGFKEPTFEENFNTGFSNGNADLKPEHSRSWEVGVEQTTIGGALFFSATYFSQTFRDLIQYTFNPAMPASPNYFNVAEARASGLELTGRTVLAGRVTLQGTYTFLHTEATNSGFDAGPNATFVTDSALLRRPPHTVAVQAWFDLLGRGNLGGAVRYVGERADRDFSRFQPPRVWLPSYTVVDLSGELGILRTALGLTVTVRVENALDRKYTEIANFPARGRVVMLGGRIRL